MRGSTPPANTVDVSSNALSGGAMAMARLAPACGPDEGSAGSMPAVGAAGPGLGGALAVCVIGVGFAGGPSDCSTAAPASTTTPIMAQNQPRARHPGTSPRAGRRWPLSALSRRFAGFARDALTGFCTAAPANATSHQAKPFAGRVARGNPPDVTSGMGLTSRKTD
jgi:hypothetical protein